MNKKLYHGAFVFRSALFIAAFSLAVYIPYKYATTLHAYDGLYAILFPFSGFLALAGITFAVKPMACDCSLGIRSGIGGLSVLWGGVGMMCGGALFDAVLATPLMGIFATFQMFVQHIFLPSALLGFVIAPAWVLSRLGIEQPVKLATATTIAAGAFPANH